MEAAFIVRKLVEISSAFDSVEAKRYGGILPLWLVAGAARLHAPELIDWRGHNNLRPMVVKAGLDSGILKSLDSSGSTTNVVLLLGKQEAELKLPTKSGTIARVQLQEKRKAG